MDRLSFFNASSEPVQNVKILLLRDSTAAWEHPWSQVPHAVGLPVSGPDWIDVPNGGFVSRCLKHVDEQSFTGAQKAICHVDGVAPDCVVDAGPGIYLNTVTFWLVELPDGTKRLIGEGRTDWEDTILSE